MLRARLDLDPAVRVEPVNDPPPSPDVEGLLGRFEEQLERLGFRRLPRAEIRGLVTGARTLAAVLLDERRDRVATRYAIYNPKGQLQTCYADVTCRLANGVVLAVGNAKQVGSFSPSPRRRAFALPQVEDVALLVRLHDEALTRFGDGERPLPLSAEDAPEFLAGLCREDLEHQVSAGYLRSHGLRLVPTWKGAALMTWKQLFPWRRLQARRRDRRSALLLSSVSLR